jgi:predicted ArsR family transcriptional regulator
MACDPSDVSGVAALAEPVRRRLYDVVVAAGAPLGREEAAARAGVAVHTAKFHLERLVEEGLLEIEFRRLSGRSGPGAGRPAKLYRRGAREISVSLPARQYDLLSRILAAAVASADGSPEPVAQIAARVARREGEILGSASRAGGDELARVADVLGTGGYEPHVQEDAVRLRNCPFHRAAQEQTALVCNLNHAYVAGVCDGLGCRSVSAELEPEAGHCCVVVRSRDA